MPRSRLKVLFLVESLSGGGAEKVLSGLVRGLDRERFDVTVCTVVDCGPYREEVGKYAHYRTIVGGRGWLYRLKYALVYRFLPAGWIYKWCIAGDYDVEAAFTEGFPTRLLAAAPEGKARRLAWVHVDLEAPAAGAGVPVAGGGKEGLRPFSNRGACVANRQGSV